MLFTRFFNMGCHFLFQLYEGLFVLSGCIAKFPCSQPVKSSFGYHIGLLLVFANLSVYHIFISTQYGDLGYFPYHVKPAVFFLTQRLSRDAYAQMALIRVYGCLMVSVKPSLSNDSVGTLVSVLRHIT